MKYNRINEIQAYLRKVKSATNEELIDIFKISSQTLRRDLKVLEDKSIVSKVYGGVFINEEESMKDDSFRDIKLRTTSHIKEKEIIGELAASLIEQNDTIFIDSGTTTCHIIPYLDKSKNITVITHSVIAMDMLKDMDGVKVILLGGEYLPRTRSFNFNQNDSHFYYSKAFIATVGLSINKGLTNMDLFDGNIKRYIINHSDEIYLMCDSSKFGCVAFNRFAEIEMINTLITDKLPETKFINYFKKHKIKVITPDIL
ncbi:MAG: DeoR/GlpR family DNA-binding transcription regulator [Erysipelotrichaceae bacterium]|jgi:DeoR family myo-inositol catabolism operon transcriptional repressor